VVGGNSTRRAGRLVMARAGGPLQRRWLFSSPSTPAMSFIDGESLWQEEKRSFSRHSNGSMANWQDSDRQKRREGKKVAVPSRMSSLAEWYWLAEIAAANDLSSPSPLQMSPICSDRAIACHATPRHARRRARPLLSLSSFYYCLPLSSLPPTPPIMSSREGSWEVVGWGAWGRRPSVPVRSCAAPVMLSVRQLCPSRRGV